MVTRKIVVRGMVQGIGYRPFAAELAEQLHITGWVRNTDGVVTVLASGSPEQMDELIRRLKEEVPAGGWVERIESKDQPLQQFDDFSIVESLKGQKEKVSLGMGDGVKAAELPLLPADLPTCKSCVRELHEKGNRRFGHPFISCTACGPRYSIIEDIPYDREHITMKKFSLCPECGAEYRRPGNPRRHAQTIACKSCGPKLRFLEIAKAAVVKDEQAISAAVRHLRQGGILAVKDIGGYHLAALPFAEETVQELRRLKGREKKPFAVMFPDVESVRKYCRMDEGEEALLCSAPRPIVLLKKKMDGKYFCRNVCGSSPDVGAMLPCNPVQIMLTEELGPLIMTSANISGGLLITEEEQIIEWLESMHSECLLAVLSHNRPIVTPLDDSIVRMVCGNRQTLRRGRGLVPEPVSFPYRKSVFAAGGDLKACFCYTGDGKAYLSQHLGDLFEESCFQAYQKEVFRMERLFGFRPEGMACDKHPGYRSVHYVTAGNVTDDHDPEGKGGQRGGNIKASAVLQIQHHKAHVASVIAEHDLRGSVLGFAFDGTGYGDDGTVWGSEVFLWDGCEMERKAHLKPLFLIGGDEGAKNADTILYGYLASFSEKTADYILEVLEKRAFFSAERYGIIKKAIGLRLNCVSSTSMGRLFDAVSAFLDICHYDDYEGQAAIELENCAAGTEEVYPLSFGLRQDSRTGRLLMDTEPLFFGMAEALRKKADVPPIARGFLFAVADMIVEISGRLGGEVDLHRPEQEGALHGSLRSRKERTAVALSGGTFLNRILLERVTLRLEELGYGVYRNEQVPPGDGGICLGQAYLAACSLLNPRV